MKIQFFIQYHTQYGESLWIQGPTAAPGKDSPPQLMKYFNFDFWEINLDIDLEQCQHPLPYQYILQDQQGNRITESPSSRSLMPQDLTDHCIIYDTWMGPEAIELVFYSAPFEKVFFQKPNQPAPHPVKNPTHIFKIKAPALETHESICLLGSSLCLSQWDTQYPIPLFLEGSDWVARLNLEETTFPLAYKYGIYNHNTQQFQEFETGPNRVCSAAVTKNTLIVHQDGFIRLPAIRWKGAGIAIPVFSLRSGQSGGIGEFRDLKLLVDWAQKTGFKLIQILPINDTSAHFTWQDSYPYAAISAFALHPIYLNLAEVNRAASTQILTASAPLFSQLNQLPTIDYEAVLSLKLSLLKKLFERQGKRDLASKDYQQFFERNSHWLVPYSVFCCLRDTFGTTDHSKWPQLSEYQEAEVFRRFEQDPLTLFYTFLQFHLHLQLRSAVDYAHTKGIVLKGDIPIGVYRYGADTWQSPQLFHMDLQAGAPPDDFAINGQNWGFPTYNWEVMEAHHFDWWQKRFKQMSHYFDAFRIDHILGFFRIWSIPLHAVQGIMGRFEPAIPLPEMAFTDVGIDFDAERFCKPFINSIVLDQVLDNQAQAVKAHFMQTNDGFTHQFREEFDTQQKLQQWLDQPQNSDWSTHIKEALFQLQSNVILFRDLRNPDSNYHFRFGMQGTSSFQALPLNQQEKLLYLYHHYFFELQEDHWKKEALQKLPALKAATQMLICGEDLGMVPTCVPQVMQQLGILSLEIQRMPKQAGQQFFDPATAPYLSVVSPSTHDMSTLREWWTEDADITQLFYQTQLHQSGPAPQDCTPQINRAIVDQHLQSPAMWSIFQLQDLLGMDDSLRRADPTEERINIPANPNHYWRYRMHISLEDLLNAQSFNEALTQQIRWANR